MDILQQAWEYNFFTEKNPFKESRILIEIRWNKPPQNIIKLNIDGAFSKSTLEAGLGGVFRNKNGDWIFGLLMHQLKHPILRHNFKEGNVIAHLLAKEAVKNFKVSKCVHHARPPCFAEPQLLKNKYGYSIRSKLVATTV
uniref:Uncharacterized protein LOC104238303 n=1 Tax=Nicotiana sylvestris TaxID=4096 RepID=A0A1U7XMU0_NICSY|nr:PREDICTED: uncharacterized protein LOC104238303 [Nicotiana sylvestris]